MRSSVLTAATKEAVAVTTALARDQRPILAVVGIDTTRMVLPPCRMSSPPQELVKLREPRACIGTMPLRHAHLAAVSVSSGQVKTYCVLTQDTQATTHVVYLLLVPQEGEAEIKIYELWQRRR